MSGRSNPKNILRNLKTLRNVTKGKNANKDITIWTGTHPNLGVVVYKECGPYEIMVQQALSNGLLPKTVPYVRESGILENGKAYMVCDYMRNGSLSKYGIHGKIPIKTLVVRTLRTLQLVKSKFREFRHNDLHLGNILIANDNGDIVLNDFGLSNLRNSNRNPIFTDPGRVGEARHYGDNYGIFVGNHPMYDVHFFINCIYGLQDSDLKRRIEAIFPPEYLGEQSPKIYNFRLRADQTHPRFDRLTIDDVIAAFTGGIMSTFTVFNNPLARIPTSARRSPPRPSGPAYSLRNMKLVWNRRNELVRYGVDPAQAERDATKFLNLLKRVHTNLVKKRPRYSPKPVLVPIKGNMPKVRNDPMFLPIKKNIANVRNVPMFPPIKGDVPRVKNKPSMFKTRPTIRVLATATPVPTGPILTIDGGRVRINGKLCTSYLKADLVSLARLINPVITSAMTVSQISVILSGAPPVASAAVATPRLAGGSGYRVNISGDRPKIDGKLCIGRTKPEIIKLLRELGYSPDPTATKEVLCSMLKRVESSSSSSATPRTLSTNLTNILRTSNPQTVTRRSVQTELTKRGHPNIPKNRINREYQAMYFNNKFENVKFSRITKPKLLEIATFQQIPVGNRNTVPILRNKIKHQFAENVKRLRKNTNTTPWNVALRLPWRAINKGELKRLFNGL
jgi:hypothetical protein